MPQAPLPPDEAERQATLDRLNILDTPIDKRFERITRLVCNALDVPQACFTLVDNDRLWFKSSQGMDNIVEHSRKDAFCSYTILSDNAMIVKDSMQDDRFKDNQRAKDGIVFYVGQPIHAPDGQRIGALCGVDSHSRDIAPAKLELLKDLAQILEAELKMEHMNDAQSDLIEKLANAERLAMIDFLTRIWNRAGIMDIFKREWAEALRQKKQLAVVMADIDFFKKINDQYGHAGGDIVIQEVAKRFVSALRTEDAVGRVGGEEFLIILRGCTPEKLFDTVERMRKEITGQPIQLAEGPINITISMGAVSEMPHADSDMTEAIKNADECLYKAKNSGRDRTVVETKLS